jgi:hypothetical protein
VFFVCRFQQGDSHYYEDDHHIHHLDGHMCTVFAHNLGDLI